MIPMAIGGMAIETITMFVVPVGPHYTFAREAASDSGNPKPSKLSNPFSLLKPSLSINCHHIQNKQLAIA